MIKQIDRDPPAATGNPQTDIRAMETYLVYLREQLNYILMMIQRGQNNGS